MYCVISNVYCSMVSVYSTLCPLTIYSVQSAVSSAITHHSTSTKWLTSHLYILYIYWGWCVVPSLSDWSVVNNKWRRQEQWIWYVNHLMPNMQWCRETIWKKSKRKVHFFFEFVPNLLIHNFFLLHLLLPLLCFCLNQSSISPTPPLLLLVFFSSLCVGEQHWVTKRTHRVLFISTRTEKTTLPIVS